MFFSKRPEPLTNLQPISAADLATKANLSPQAKAMILPGQSTSDFLHALEQNKLPLDAMKALAFAMPERDAVSMACQSALKVAEKLNPEELAATRAAEAWLRNPNEATKAAAGEAAAKTDFRGPGGWAAQAAAWTTGSASAAPGAAAAPPLTPAAVAGAVLLASGLVNRPPMSAPQKFSPTAAPAPKVEMPTVQPEIPQVDQSKLVKPLAAFLGLGKDIAAGKGGLA